jgi:hypothetical protein
MARRRKTRTVYRYARRATRYKRGSGKFNNIITGIIAGVLGSFASKYIGGYGHPAAAIGVGYFKNNSVLMTEGGRELGSQIAQMIPFVGGSTIGGVGGTY